MPYPGALPRLPSEQETLEATLRAWNPPDGLEGTVHVLRALAHPGRALIFRTLSQAGPAGMGPEELAAALGLRGSSLVAHLSCLADVGLIHGARGAEAVRYIAGRDVLDSLTDFLMPGVAAKSG
jgi:DNA-binding transcriptional ArsR family regulator